MDAGNSQNSYITKEEFQFFESSLKEEREVLRGRRKDSAKLLKEYSDAEEVNETLIVSQDAEKKIKEINGALEYTCKITKAANGEPTKSFKKI